jgi:hypothetical protein
MSYSKRKYTRFAAAGTGYDEKRTPYRLYCFTLGRIQRGGKLGM